MNLFGPNPPHLKNALAGQATGLRYTIFQLQLVSSVVAPLDSNSGVAEQTKVKTPDPKAKTPEPQIGTTTGLDGCDNERDITEAIERIESVIFPALQGICPDKLQTTDGILR